MKDLQDQDQSIIDLAASCQYDPVLWSRVAYDWGYGDLSAHSGPRAWQDDIGGIIRDHLADPATRHQPLRIAVASGHGIGKSAQMGMLSNWAMSCWSDAKVLVTSNTGDQLTTKTSPEIGLWFRRSITSHWFTPSTMSIKSKDPRHESSWRLDFVTWSDNNTEAFAGLHNEGRIIVLLFDEASGISDKVWEVALGAMTDENTVIIWIAFGNPTQNTGMFRECFRRFKHRWVSRHIDSRTVEGTNKQYLQQIVDDYGEDSDEAKVRVRGLFPSQSVSQFISEDSIRAAMKREVYTDLTDVLILGVDVARFGDDSSFIVARRGNDLKSIPPIKLDKVDTMQLAGRVKEESDRLNADAVFIDEGGIGAGVVDRCHQLGMRNVVGVNFGGAADRVIQGLPKCKNKRSQMWATMRMAIDSGLALRYHEPLVTEMSSPLFSYDENNAIQLEKKQDMKKRGVPSPDESDAIALTYAYPVTARRVMEAHDAWNSKDYDPWG